MGKVISMQDYIERKAVIIDHEFDEFFKALVDKDLYLARQIIEDIRYSRDPF